MSRSDPALETTVPASRTDQLIARVLDSRAGQLAYRFRRLVPVASFAIGLGSYFLIQRQNALAQWLTALMLLGWVALLFEGLLCRILARFVGERVPQILVRYAAQVLHQETLFFVLPFFLTTTTWRSAQCVFTGLIVIAAVASTIDPLYYDVIARRRWLFLGYHAFTLFAAILAGGPIILSLTTGNSIALASAVMGVCALPSFNDVLRARHWSRWFVLAGLSIALGGGAWMARFWIPPATLNAKHMAITTRMDTANRQPGPDQHHFTVAQLRTNGLYAFSAIKAPRGLHQKVLHVWSHDGKVVSRIPLHIRGGTRNNGFRTWSHKTSLGPNPVGYWRVAVVTDDGQLIGAERFTVDRARGNGPGD
ncbi:DUF5924 family protein [Salinisphaera sp. LB1]|uniref:DUF5924 family protein n=1 Tax=Salinisphaera sp. LB1 TaxID=2183911 RepID=UPI000D7D5DC1|nr:DUF5924 family protein [Salinisphaera sp. LB1]AWN15152.1 membrane protein, putative [Salinisphaera sp. LB1]